MNILRTHHVAVICSDFETSKCFYMHILGLEVVSEVYRPERKYYKLGLRLPDNTQIELFFFPTPPKWLSYPEACGLRHLAFEVANVDEAVKELERAGVVVEKVRVDEHTGKRFTFFADPDGLPLELYERWGFTDTRIDTEQSTMNTAATVRTDFATPLYEKLAGTEAGENLFLSPFSIQVALAMCAVGAKGETRRVMANLIGAPESVDEQNRQYGTLLKSVHGEGERPFQLVTANALWGQQGYHFKLEFQEAIADFYDGALHEVNFRTQPAEAVKTINGWVSNKTQARIKNLIKRRFINDATCLILTNAIYFKGQWEREFEKAATRNEDWHGPTDIDQVPMMHQRGGYLYYDGGGFQALDIPYKGEQLSMLVVLPRKRNGLPSLESQWAAGGTQQKVTAGLRHEETVIVSLPRFKMETEFELKPELCALGADLAFSGGADFSGIGDESLAISEVVHKAFVEVNEEGTEAAAATAVVMTRCAAIRRTQPPIIFKADHPFLFFIRDRTTNAVLFSGRLLDPR